MFSNSRGLTILYSHPNAEDLGSSMNSLMNMAAVLQCDIVSYDYSGYGPSEMSAGRPRSELPNLTKALLNIRAVFCFMVETLEIPAHKIVLFGRSIGTAMTIDLASVLKDRIPGIIVHSAFISLIQVITWLPCLYPVDRYRNAEKIKEVECRVQIVHAKDDQMMGPWHPEVCSVNYLASCVVY